MGKVTMRKPHGILWSKALKRETKKHIYNSIWRGDVVDWKIKDKLRTAGKLIEGKGPMTAFWANWSLNYCKHTHKNVSNKKFVLEIWKKKRKLQNWTSLEGMEIRFFITKTKLMWNGMETTCRLRNERRRPQTGYKNVETTKMILLPSANRLNLALLSSNRRSQSHILLF